MINFVIIVVLVVLAIVIFKFKEFRHRMGLLTIIVLILIIILSFSIVISGKGVDFNTFDGVVKAGKLYFSWLGGAFHNLKDLSGYAVKQEWGVNSTNTEESVRV